MMPPEFQSRSFRPHISASTSAPSFSSITNGSLYDQNPRSSFLHRRGSSSSSSRSLKNSRFVYNSRIAIALVPSAAFLLDLGGAPVFTTLTLGLMVSYILDSLDFKPGAFFAVWFSLAFSQISFFFTSSLNLSFNSLPLAILAVLLCAEANFLIGAWASLQFKWIQIESPSIVLALERVLFACVPFAASALFTWATVLAVGMINASYYLMVFNCIFYWLYSIPRLSSFKNKQEAKFHGGVIPDDNLILGPLESCVHSLNLMFVPLLFHIASHYSVVFSSAASICDLLLLFFVPFVFQLYASTRGALWWVTKDANQLHGIRVANGAVAIVVVVICLEIRVVFHSFGRYIQVPPPLNYVLVTTTMLGGVAGAGAYVMGMVSDALSSVAFTALAVIVSAAGAIVVGFPVMVYALDGRLILLMLLLER